MGGRTIFRSIVLVAGLVLGVAASALAGTYTVLGTSLVSTSNPYSACSVGAVTDSVLYPDGEVEPSVAVDPTASNNLVGIFQQDRWSDGGSHGVVTANSTNGGGTWSLASSQPDFSQCVPSSSSPYPRSTDPWIAFDSSGDVYAISLGLSADQVTSAVQVSSSTNNGDTWSTPTTLIEDSDPLILNDKTSITGDPRTDVVHQHTVYVAWDRIRKPGRNVSPNSGHSFGFRGDPMFSKTTNGGTTWSTPRNLFHGNSNLFTFGDQIAVTPAGTLIDIFNLGKGSGIQGSNQDYQAVIRSTDDGATWSKPIIISKNFSRVVRDPDTGAPVRGGDGIPDIAVNPVNGDVYAVWMDVRFSGGAYDDVAFSQSTDDGLSWSPPVKVNLTPSDPHVPDRQAFEPQVHVASNGVIGVSYYDFRNNTAVGGALTDAFVAHCHASCTSIANWSETRVTATSFDIEDAPVARGYFLGDYMGLTNVGTSFGALYVTSGSGTTSPPTDVYWSKVGP